MEVVLGREKDSSGDELTCPLLEAAVDNADVEEFVERHNEESPPADSGHYSDDENNWEEIRDGSIEVEAVPHEEETLASVERKLQSILRAEPQVFTVKESMPKKRKNKYKKRGSFQQHHRKSVVFHLPEDAVIPERVSCKPGQAPFPSRARKTLLVLRKKITGEKEEIPWRASSHCSPILLEQRAKKFPKDYYLKHQKEIYVRSIDLSDDEDEDTEEKSALESDGAMRAAMHPDVVIDAYRIAELAVEQQSTSNADENQDSALLIVKDASSDCASVDDDESDEHPQPSRRQSLRMQLGALQLHYQMNPKSLKKAPTYRTGGHGLGHSNPKVALTRSTKLEAGRKLSKENQVAQEGSPVKKLSNDESDKLKIPGATRKISPASPNPSLKSTRSRNSSRDNIAQAAKHARKISRDNTVSAVKILPVRKISRDNTASGGKVQPVRKISRDNTVPGGKVQPVRKISRDNTVSAVQILPVRKISRDNTASGGKVQPVRKISRDNTVSAVKILPVRKISRDNTASGGKVQPVRKISRDNTASENKVHPLHKTSRDNTAHHGIIIKAHKGIKDHAVSNVQFYTVSASHPEECSVQGKHDARKPKSSKTHPFKYLNTKLAFKLAQHFSGSESEGERSRSSSRHNSESMSEDTIEAILSKEIPPPPRAPSTGGPGKVVRTRYRKVSREEAKPYPKDGEEKSVWMHD